MSKLSEVTTKIVVEEREIAKVIFTDIGNDKYFSVKIEFPNGSYRQLYCSWSVLEDNSKKKLA